MTDEWIPGPTDPNFNSAPVHVWRVSIDDFIRQVEDFKDLLAADELERAGRYYFDKDRLQFIVARGVLRRLLARYTGCDARKIEFGYAERGKPFLIGNDGFEPLEFNLSHSGGLILVGFAQGRPVGVDVEHVRTDFEGEKIAEDLFSPCEKLMLAATPEAKRREAFFTCWTCKEAYIKARGAGLSMPLNEFDVSSAMEEGKTFIVDTSEGFSRWWVRRLNPGQGYAGAVSAEGRFCPYAFFDLKEC